MRMMVGRTRTSPILEDFSSSKLSVPVMSGKSTCEPTFLFGILPTIKEDHKGKKRSNICTEFIESAWKKHWPSLSIQRQQEDVGSMAINAASTISSRRRVGEEDHESLRRPCVNFRAGSRSARPRASSENRLAADVQTTVSSAADSVGSDSHSSSNKILCWGNHGRVFEATTSSMQPPRAPLPTNHLLRESGPNQEDTRFNANNKAWPAADACVTTASGLQCSREGRTDQNREPSSASAKAAIITAANPVSASSQPTMSTGRPLQNTGDQEGQSRPSSPLSQSGYNCLEGNEASLSSSGSLFQRPRSRAIAIKRRTNHYFYATGASQYGDEFPSNQSENTSEKMYDWATWRMYNRIVDHRRNQQRLKARNGISLVSEAVPAGGFLPTAVDPSSAYDSTLNSYRHDAYEAGVFGSCDYIHDGEVFELDDI